MKVFKEMDYHTLVIGAEAFTKMAFHEGEKHAVNKICEYVSTDEFVASWCKAKHKGFGEFLCERIEELFGDDDKTEEGILKKV